MVNIFIDELWRIGSHDSDGAKSGVYKISFLPVVIVKCFFFFGFLRQFNQMLLSISNVVCRIK